MAVRAQVLGRRPRLRVVSDAFQCVNRAIEVLRPHEQVDVLAGPDDRRRVQPSRQDRRARVEPSRGARARPPRSSREGSKRRRLEGESLDDRIEHEVELVALGREGHLPHLHPCRQLEIGPHHQRATGLV